MKIIVLLILIILATGALAFALSRFFFNGMNEAEKQYRRGEARRSIALLKTLLEREPDNEQARWFLASLLYERGEYGDAVAYAKPLVVRPPAGVSHVAVIAFVTRTLMLLGRDAEALAILRDLKELHPEEPAVLELFAEAAERCGLPQEAVRAYERLEEKEPLPLPMLYRLGRLLLRTGQVEKSISRLKAAAAAMPDQSEAAEALAEALCQVWRYDEARMVYQQLYEKAYDHRKVAIGRHYAEVLEQLGLVKAAVEVLQHCADLPEALPREAAEMFYISGDLLNNLGKPDLAEAAWKKVLEKMPEHPGARRRLGYQPKPTDRSQLIAFIRGLTVEEFQMLCEKILIGWGYTIAQTVELNRQTAQFIVNRYENGKDRQKLVSFDRWENEAGDLIIKELKLRMMEKNLDGSVFISLGSYTPAAILFANRSRSIELFSASELLPALQDIDLQEIVGKGF